MEKNDDEGEHSIYQMSSSAVFESLARQPFAVVLAAEYAPGRLSQPLLVAAVHRAAASWLIPAKSERLR
jgi:hypothetical protein